MTGNVWGNEWGNDLGNDFGDGPVSATNDHRTEPAMSIDALIGPKSALTRALDALQPAFALGSRVYVSWVFLKSGYLKVSDWGSTLALFEYEYRVPLLSPTMAAVAGTAGELIFPSLLILGWFGRISALGLQAVNVLAVVSYAHVLFQEGFDAAIGQHYLWGYMLALLAIYGPGAWSLDHWLTGRQTDRLAARHGR
jgi:putative oxidoreductase